MSITGIKKRIAFFYDDKGQYLGKKSFSNDAQVFHYGSRSYNVVHENMTFTPIKRWYWNLEIYHYNINNPNPIVLDKKSEPILDAELYNIQLKTKVARDLNDLSKDGLFANLNFKTVLIIIVIVAIIYLISSGQIKLK